jgi:hypothetical protein
MKLARLRHPAQIFEAALCGFPQGIVGEIVAKIGDLAGRQEHQGPGVDRGCSGGARAPNGHQGGRQQAQAYRSPKGRSSTADVKHAACLHRSGL